MYFILVVMFCMALIHWVFEAISVPQNFNPEIGKTLDVAVTPLSVLTVNVRFPLISFSSTVIDLSY